MGTNRDVKIPSYTIFINPSDFRDLRNDIWSNEHIPAKLKYNKNLYNIEIAYRGALTRDLPKKSFHVNFIKPGAFYGQRELHLNAEYRDPSLLRNKLSFDFFRSIGCLSPDSRFILLNINGSFQGVYLQLESVDDLFLHKRGLPEGAIFYAHNDDANFSLLSPDTDDVKSSLTSGYKLKTGTEKDKESLSQLIFKINTVPRSDFQEEIIKLIDIEKYFRWLAGVVCTQNYDGFIQNYALYRNSETGLFQLTPWDYDGTWGRDCHGKPLAYDYVPIDGCNTLTARLLDVALFRHQYRQLLEEILDNYFTVEKLGPKITSLYQMLHPHVLQDPYKKKSIKLFASEPELIIKFIADRNSYLRDHLADLN